MSVTRRPLLRLVAALLMAACQSAPAVPPSTPAATAITGAQVSTPPTVRFWIDDPRYYVIDPREMIVDGDRELLLGFDFGAPMQRAEVERRLRSTLPPGSTYDWQSAAELRVTVPAGDSFDVELTGARSRSGVALTGAAWRIARPVSEFALYRLDRLLRGWPPAERTWRVRLAVQPGVGPIIAPDGESALLYHGITPRRSEFSLVHLPTGRHLAQPFPNIASHGWTVMDWTADGRLLVAAASPQTWLGDERGRDPVALRSLEGQGGLLSPSRRYLYLWSCTVREAWMLDLQGGHEWRLGDAQLPCSHGDHVMWTASDELNVSEIASEDPLTLQTDVFDPSGRLRRSSTVRYVPIVALADGAFVVGHRIPHAHRDDGGPFYLRDTRGREHALPPNVHFRPSPDRRLLAFTSLDGNATVANVWSVSGDPPLIMRDASVGGWTKDGALAIVTTVP